MLNLNDVPIACCRLFENLEITLEFLSDTTNTGANIALLSLGRIILLIELVTT